MIKYLFYCMGFRTVAQFSLVWLRKLFPKFLTFFRQVVVSTLRIQKYASMDWWTSWSRESGLGTSLRPRFIWDSRDCSVFCEWRYVLSWLEVGTAKLLYWCTRPRMCKQVAKITQSYGTILCISMSRVTFDRAVRLEEEDRFGFYICCTECK